MHARLLVAALLLAVAVAGTQALAASTRALVRGSVCGQIKHGPHAAYWSNVSGIRSKGTTWTVLATDVSCTYAMKQVPALLKQWQHAKPGARLGLAGATCIVSTDRAYSGSGTSSGGFVCHKGSGAAAIFSPSTFAARETDPYTVAQIKAFFGLK